jgi:class 3 adenylate cyclase/tetratricopeptide (TPR) repeat protein
MGEERKVVTILFADVIGSTALGEQLDPERLRALLGTYFSAMAAIIESWGGTVEKYIGDAIMAVFGVPAVHEDDADRALRAALEMQERLGELNAEFARRHQVSLQIRIGVNTGEVVAAIGPAPEQQIVAGDAVNVAQRLEAAAEAGSVLVGERTFSATERAFRFADPLTLELKGKSEAARAHPLIDALPAPGRGMRGLNAPMIGRDRELAALLGLMDETVETGQPRLVVVYGPAGIGKSRLTREFLAEAQRSRPELRVLRGRSLSAGHGITYWALGEILRGACEIGLDEPIEVVRDRLRSGVAEVLSPLGLPADDADRTIASLATTVGIQLGAGEGRESAPASADELARAWPRFATAYVTRGPAIWVVEDLHWAGEPAVEMLAQIARRTEGPLLLVATARPEFADDHPGFGPGGQDAFAVSLRPLTERQAGDLVDQLLAVAELPGDLRADILTKADGNPFFVEEILQRLIDEGALQREGDHWRPTATVRAVHIPDSVQALLAARIDALPAEERRTLQEAAVVGRTFWKAGLEGVVESEQLETALGGLERKGLVLIRSTSSFSGQTEYLFKHALVRDVAYSSLPKARRARAHAEVANWIAALSTERTDEFAELVAHHYLAAIRGDGADLAWLDDPDAGEAIRRRAVPALLEAGRAARHRFALDRAVELHEQALELAATDAERLDALEQIARDHEAAFHGEQALEAFRAALEIARRDPDARDRVAVLARHAVGLVSFRSGSFSTPWDMDAIDALTAEGLAAVSDDRERVWLLASYAIDVRFRLMAADAPNVPLGPRFAAVEEAAAIASRLGDASLQALAADVIGDLHVLEGDFPAAWAVFDAQVPVIARIDRPAAKAGWIHSAAGRVLELRADPLRALALAQEAYDLGGRLSSHDRAHGIFSLMDAYYWLGEWDRVEELLAEHLANPELKTGARCVSVQSGPSLGALVIAHRGNPQRALEIARRSQAWEANPGAVEGHLAEALVAAGAIEEGYELAQLVLKVARRWRWPEAAQANISALVARQAWDEAQRFVSDIADLRGGYPLLNALAERASGLASAADGSVDQARESLARSLADLDRFPMRFEAARTREALAGISQPSEQRSLLEAAAATYRDLAAAPHLARVEGLLERNEATPGT